ncbi:RusA family crossover junction endodeoxyribonuclease [Companilactobacillus sp. DQM5]|uniref:RusA family crossover junction endodeoxyribonuclease n=1 Tax=Companilactobacillus sp. DQM5 TaxID=3463359 RepID=UPI004058FE24
MKIVVEGTPQAQERPRFKRLGSHVATYDPVNSKNYKAKLKAEWIKKYGRKSMPEGVPLEISIVVYRPIQKSISKRERSLRIANKVLPIMKPDTDNYIKISIDGLNGLAFKDDNVITDIHAAKRYSGEPRLEIEIKEIELVSEEQV